MKVKVKSKRKFGLWCIVFLLMFLNLVFAVNKRTTQNIAVSENKKTVSGSTVMAADKNGSIAYSENTFFKRYIIDCKNENSQVKWEESKEYLDIVLKKNDIAKLNIKGERASTDKDIYYNTSSDNLIIRVKKIYNENNMIYIDSSDSKKIIVLIAKEENPFKHTVVLDPGHGGEDKGTNYNDIYEKDITLKIVNYTAQELMFNGFKVVKTRDQDKLLYLNEIARIANEASADLFISVHINSNKVDKYKGVTSYYYDPDGLQKEERTRLASTIQRELVKNDDWEDKGIIRNNLSVLRNSEIPCALLELGFLSNSEDRDKLLRNDVLKNFSINITNGVNNYFSAE